MNNQVRAQRGPKGPLATEAVKRAARLDGKVVVLRKARGGYIVEQTDPDRSGTRILGHFVPVSRSKGGHTRHLPADMILRTRGRGAELVSTELAVMERRTSARLAVPVRVPDPAPVENLRDREVRRWREIRESFLREDRSVTAPELAVLTDSRSRNPSSRAHELRIPTIAAIDSD